MATKKTATKKASKTTKAPLDKKSKSKSSPIPEAAPVAGECPKGGAHEWHDEDGSRVCSKCLEPAGEPKKARPSKAKGEKKIPANGKKLSAIDAAAKVLAETAEPMNCKALVDKMAAKGYWTSPGGKTPAQTLYSAISREIGTKGKEARFKKTERGLFAANG